MADTNEKVQQFFGLCQSKGVDIPTALRSQLLEESQTLLIEDNPDDGSVNDSHISKNTQDFILCLAILIQQNVPFMRWLHIRGLQISDQTMNTVSVAIKKNQTLQGIVIESAGISDEGALSLSLGLQSNIQMTINLCICMLQFDLIVIHSVSLPRNNLTTYGLDNLMECLSTNSNITNLDLSENQVVDIPQSLEIFLKADTYSLQSLNLNYNPLSEEAILMIIGALTQNQSVTQLGILSPTLIQGDLEDAFILLLEANQTLRHISISINEESICGKQKIIDAFMKIFLYERKRGIPCQEILYILTHLLLKMTSLQ